MPEEWTVKDASEKKRKAEDESVGEPLKSGKSWYDLVVAFGLYILKNISQFVQSKDN